MTQEAVERKPSPEYQANFQRLLDALGSKNYKVFEEGNEMLIIHQYDKTDPLLHLSHAISGILDGYSVTLSTTYHLRPEHPYLIGAHVMSSLLLFAAHDARTLNPSDENYDSFSGEINERIKGLIAKFIDKANTGD